MKHIGFTGTQEGMTAPQFKKFCQVLADYNQKQFDRVAFHHGDCIGADNQAHKVAEILKFEIHVHPPISNKKRAFNIGYKMHPQKGNLERNQDIAKACSTLIATPMQEKEILRSGTWSTVRYARKWHRKVIIIYPSGDKVME